MCHSKE